MLTWASTEGRIRSANVPLMLRSPLPAEPADPAEAAGDAVAPALTVAWTLSVPLTEVALAAVFAASCTTLAASAEPPVVAAPPEEEAPDAALELAAPQPATASPASAAA